MSLDKHNDNMSIVKKLYKRNSDVELFEIGYRDLEADCAYVLNPSSGQLEEIHSVECGDREGQEYSRVETYPDSWYEIDGLTILAKRVSKVAS